MSGIPGDPPPFEPFPVTSSERLHDSPWCGLRRDQIDLGGGRAQDYHVFEVSEAVCVVPIATDGSLVAVWQYRHPLGATHWEVPAGRVDDGEAPAVAAARELLEETGHRPARLEAMADYYPINGISPHHAHLFVAHGCEAVGEPVHGPTERMSVHRMPLDEARARLLRGDFVDGFSALALFNYFARHPRR